MNDNIRLKVTPYVRDLGSLHPFRSTISLSVNFEREVVTFTFKSYDDILTKLGGLKASLSPILSFITPLIMLNFLISLSGVIQEIYTKKYA